MPSYEEVHAELDKKIEQFHRERSALEETIVLSHQAAADLKQAVREAKAMIHEYADDEARRILRKRLSQYVESLK